MKLEKIPFNNKNEWLELRRMGIGGSDAAILAGDNKYSTPYTLWLDKLGKQKPFEGNEATRQGTDLEEYVAKRFTDLTGKKVHKVNFILRNPDYDFALANVDRMVTGENAGLECKTMNPIRYNRIEEGEFPISYYAQCQHYMAVTGADKWYLAILVFGKDFIVHEIERDEEYIKELMEFEKSFWNENVLKEIPPAVDGNAPTEEGLQSYFNSPKKDSKKQLINQDKTIKEYFKLKEKEKEVKEEINLIKQQLEAELGDFEIAESDNYRVTWKPQTRRNFDYKRFISEHPKFDYAPYYNENTKRVLRIREF